MPTLILDPPPAGLQELIERRRRLGQDRHDEIWEGVYHMVPGPGGPHSFTAAHVAELLAGPARAAGLYLSTEFNLGSSLGDFRVPDLGVHRARSTGTWMATAAIVVEIVSPNDEAWQKLPFYARQGVDELLFVDPASRSVAWMALGDDEYRTVQRSAIVHLGPAELAAQIDWPPR